MELLGVLFFLARLKDLTIEHIGINSKPTFSYVIIHVSSSDFELEKDKEDKNIRILVRGVSPPSKKLQIRGDKLVKDLYVIPVKEDRGRISSLVSIKLHREDIDWYVVKSRGLIFVFIGKGLPFSYKIDLEEYFKESVRVGNFSALDIMFSFSQVEDASIRSLALYYIGEMFTKMGLTQRSRLLLLRAGAYYGISASEYLSLGKVEESVNSRLKASEVFRIARFYPEAEYQALQAIKTLEDQQEGIRNIPESRLGELKTLSICYRSLALAGARKFEKAVENFYMIDLGRGVPDSSRDCIYSFLGIIEFEKGNYDEAQKYLSYVSSKFIMSEPLVFQRYVKTLMNTGRLELAKKYAFSMIDSMYPEMQGQGHIYFSQILIKDGNYQTAIRYIWRTISKFAGTRWEISARLIAVENKEELAKVYNQIPKREIPKNDPVLNPLPNLRFIISRFIFPESYEAVPLYISEIINEVRESKDLDIISKEIEYLDEILKVFRVLNLPPTIREKVKEKNLELARELVKKDRKIEAVSLFVGNRDFFPPDYSEDIEFLKKLAESLGFSESATSSETPQSVKPSGKVEGRSVEDLPGIYTIRYIEQFINEKNCDKALSYFEKYNDKIKYLPDYEDIAFRLAYCLFSIKSPLLQEFCSIYPIDIFCYPSRTTYDDILDKTIKEIIEGLKHSN